jgi:aryl-alcohol dehydrogenase-like predicted oxidoreductase
MFPLVRDQGLGVMAFSPLQVGLLSGAYVPGQPPPEGTLWSERREEFDEVFRGETAAMVETAAAVARQRGVSMPQLAVNWVLARDEVSVVITGSDSVEQFDDNRAAFDWQLGDEELATLNQRHVEMMVW